MLTGTSAWMNHARCNGMSSEVFYPIADDAQALAMADKVCEECPVQVVCAAHALTHGERYGFWGGLSEDDRRAIWSAIHRGLSVMPFSMRGRARSTVERTFGEAGLALITAPDVSVRMEALRNLYIGARKRAADGPASTGVQADSNRQRRHRHNTTVDPERSPAMGDARATHRNASITGDPMTSLGPHTHTAPVESVHRVRATRRGLVAVVEVCT